MLAACPKCNTRYRIDGPHLRPEGVRLRCGRCQTVFRVQPPVGVGREAPRPPRERPAAAAPPTDVAPAKLLLVADPDAESCKATARAFESWGFHALTAHDGVEAILEIQRRLPGAVVLDAGLPKMSGFQVCELVKRNESLRGIHVVLVATARDAQRDGHASDPRYGADGTLEKPDLAEGLRPLLRRFGLEVAEAPAAPPRPTPEHVEPCAPSAPPAPSPADAALAASRAEAERLARIIVSDVVLYSEEKFARALAAGNVVEAMEPELAEGRSLFRERIDPRVQGERDFLAEELLRVARTRGKC